MRTIGLDVETSKIPFFHPWQKEAFLVAVGIVDESGYKKTWLFNHDAVGSDINQKDMIAEIQEELDKTYRIVGQNLKFDLNWLRKIGADFSKQHLYCTKIADYIINGQKRQDYSLDAIAERWDIKLKIDKVKTFWDAGYETSEIPLNILIPYLEQDCINALAIYQKQVNNIQKNNLVTPVSLANKLQRILSQIECTGIKADKELGNILVADIQQQLDLIDLGLYKLLGEINLSSGDELSAALFGGVLKRQGMETARRTLKSGEIKEYERKCTVETVIPGAGFKPKEGTETKKKGYYQTSKGIIEQLGARTKDHKEIKRGLIARSAIAQSLESLCGKQDDKGIINKIQIDGCVHPQYNQAVTVTGRLSSSDPNGQNLPREGTSPIKRVFIPRLDQIMSADLSQLEWRVAALLSQDPMMIKEIIRGEDVHGNNAVNFFGDIEFRKVAKFFTFRMIYGGSAYGFFMDYKMPNFSLKRWKNIVDNFYSKYTGLQDWQLNNIRKVNDTGRLYIPSDRYFAFQQIGSFGDYSPRHIKNYPVQGFSFDIVALAMLIIDQKMKQQNIITKMIAQIHDEIVFDNRKREFFPLGRICIEVFENLPKYMKQYWNYDCNVPFTGSIAVGPNYEQMEEIDRSYFFK